MANARRWLVFDLGGVLFHFHPERRLRAFANGLGLKPDIVRRQLFDSGFANACDRGRFNAAAMVRQANKLLGVDCSPAQFADLWMTVFEPNVALATQLAPLREHYALAMLTDNSALVREQLERRWPDLLAPFRPRLFSCDVGVTKPHVRLFETLLSVLEATPEQVLYVDDVPAFVDAAQAFGMRAVRFTGAEPLRAQIDVAFAEPLNRP